MCNSNSNAAVIAAAPFGIAGAASYDEDASRMPGRYKRAHLIQNSLIISALRRNRSVGNQVVVDFGAGTGNDAMEILLRWPSAFYVGIDSSHAMIARAKEKLHSRGVLQRSLFLHGSFETIRASDVTGALQNVAIHGKIVAVMSALALHHYELAYKRCVFALAQGLLSRGSLFVLTDLFSNHISDCAQHALDTEIEEIRLASRRSRKNLAKNGHPTTFSVEHYTQSNNPQDLAQEINLLRKCLFSHVDVVYRDGQLAVLAAERAR